MGQRQDLFRRLGFVWCDTKKVWPGGEAADTEGSTVNLAGLGIALKYLNQYCCSVDGHLCCSGESPSVHAVHITCQFVIFLFRMLWHKKNLFSYVSLREIKIWDFMLLSFIYLSCHGQQTKNKTDN